ncbi:hypothetical protein HPB52_011706 [Rhipicephalus sanguineus]|uniref:Reverse transcriptase domain-containing protein n=1 Tax=Rhipicephalus sanguineus TaxID=34632 RepID=A0A9D4PRD2_RHISA|nr:hypothetical protein HPB52_011706 [Rhipicephalus sanguineus]
MRDVRGPGQGRNTSNARELATLARDSGLHDAWVLKKGGTFVPTWKRGTSETRLDRFYVSEGLIPVVADVAVGSFPPESGRISDHYPVILSMALPDRRLEGKRFWKFDLAVLADDEAKDILRAGINRTLTNARNPSLEWDALKSQWQHWAKESGRNAKMRLARDLNETLRRIRIVSAGAPLTPTTREYLELLRARYDRLFLKTTQKANLYAQDTIFRDAPELTRFLRSRRSPDGPSSYVMSVSMPDGSVSECVSDIDRRFSEYFADLFTEGDMAADSDALNNELEGLCATVSKLPAAASESLLKTVSAAEVFSVLRSMKVGSAAGPDGLPTEFYKEFWPEIGKGLVGMINEILCNERVPESLKEGKLILIPKEGKDHRLPGSWRPITVLNADYKIFAAVLVSRLKHWWPDVICTQQAGSVVGRNIFNALTLTRDLLAYMDHTRTPGLCVSLDQEHAFDRVRHEYLFAILGVYGFQPKVIDLFRIIYGNMTSTLVINGVAKGKIRLTRGVRQGCALSPMLFVLCIDPFIRSISADAKIRGLPLPGTETVLHRAVFSFFWDGSTERLQRDALRLPRCLGGYGLPCIGTMAQLLALRTVLGILDDVGAPARPLAMFFLGPLRRTLVPRALGNLYPSAVITPAYYRALVALSRELTALDPDLNPREVPPARLCEQLVSARTTLNSPPPTFPWLELTSGRLPKEAADLQWQRAWRILPTLDRLQRWGIVQYARCPNCGSTETAAHAVSTCVVARTFWRLVHRSMPSLRVANYYTRDRCPRGALGRSLNLHLSADASVFHKDLVVESSTEGIVNVDTSRIYKGYVIGKPRSRVFGSLHRGLFEGSIETGSGDSLYVERASRFFNDSRPYHSVLYSSADIEFPTLTGGGHGRWCGLHGSTEQWMRDTLRRFRRVSPKAPHFYKSRVGRKLHAYSGASDDNGDGNERQDNATTMYSEPIGGEERNTTAETEHEMLDDS